MFIRNFKELSLIRGLFSLISGLFSLLSGLISLIHGLIILISGLRVIPCEKSEKNLTDFFGGS